MQDSPYDSLDARPWLRRSSPVARLACLAYVVLIIYASFTPWSGWRDLGVGAFAYLSARWPERVVRFDAIVNVLGYMILDTYVAHPFQRPTKSWVVGIQMAPGW